MNFSLYVRVCLQILVILHVCFPQASEGYAAEDRLAREEKPYDVVLRNGRIVDGTGNPWYHGDLGIRGDRIAGLGSLPQQSGRIEFDVRGLMVAPGFIDIHSHSDWLLLEDGRAESKVRQGVTTEVLGEGGSPGPFLGKLGRRSVTVAGEAVTVASLEDYWRACERGGIAVNVASYVGLDNLWQSVMGTSFARPTEDQLAEMQRLLRESLDQGACGLSCQLAMPPGSLASTEDLITLGRWVGLRGRTVSIHNRHEGEEVIASVREVIAISERARVRVDNIHLKIADQRRWGQMKELVTLIQSARDRGVDVVANVYPYTRGNNNLASIIPPWAHEGGSQELQRRLKDSAQRERIKREIRAGLPGWYNHYLAVGGDWSRMLISGDNPLRGLTMDRVLALRAEGRVEPEDPLDALCELLLEHEGSISTVYAHHIEEDMNLAMIQPWCSIGSDGSALAIAGPLRRGHPHPRSFGTFPRVLGEYVRERKLLSWEDAIRKMTSLNAVRIGLTDRGELHEGWLADITVFHPDHIRDRATYTDPFAYSEGIQFVFVNGECVIKRGEPTGAKPGRPLRIR
jgi:N-acyl-D-amino-acid deacylase